MQCFCDTSAVICWTDRCVSRYVGSLPRDSLFVSCHQPPGLKEACARYLQALLPLSLLHASLAFLSTPSGSRVLNCTLQGVCDTVSRSPHGVALSQGSPKHPGMPHQKSRSDRTLTSPC
eukprot:1291777-Pyramimonas_sp.AAC.1